MRSDVTARSLLDLLRADVVGSLVAVRWALSHVEHLSPQSCRIAEAHVGRALARVERICSHLERAAAASEGKRRSQRRLRRADEDDLHAS